MVGPRRRRGRREELSGERVRLVAPRPEHYEEWRSLRRESRGFLSRWEPAWPRDHLDRSAYRRRLRRYEEERAAGRAYPFFLFARRDDGGALVGGLGLSHVRRGAAMTATLGYWIGAPYQRRGYMTDAIRTAVRFAFDDLELHRIEAACLEENGPSRALLLKCGFEEEGRARSYLKIDGRWRDHVLYARLSAD